MKKLRIFTITLGSIILVGFCTLQAQDTLYIYQSGMITEKAAVSDIDSMAFILGPLTLGKIRDIEGNEYRTVQIGTQTWMAENLRTLTLNEGTPIPKVTDNTDWSNYANPAYCWHENDSASNAALYGPLYNWYTASDSNLCPTGWHVPSHAEWTVLRDYLIANGYNYDGSTTSNSIGKAMASADHWNPSTGEGHVGNADYPEYRNKSGFSALPGGQRSATGFSYIGDRSYFWSSTEAGKGSTTGWFRSIIYDSVVFDYGSVERETGMSVRCVKD